MLMITLIPMEDSCFSDLILVVLFVWLLIDSFPVHSHTRMVTSMSQNAKKPPASSVKRRRFS